MARFFPKKSPIFFISLGKMTTFTSNKTTNQPSQMPLGRPFSRKKSMARQPSNYREVCISWKWMAWHGRLWWNSFFWHAEIAESYESQCDVILSDRFLRILRFLREKSSSGRFCIFCDFCVSNHRPAGSAYSADSAWEIIVRQVLRILRVLREANLSSAFGSGIFLVSWFPMFFSV